MRYQGLKQEAYDYIFELLMSNRFKHGDRIREDQIAQEMGVSRTPVREAVNQLVAEGFIVNIPRKGLFAAEVSKDDILKMIDVRTALEALAIEKCCELITDSEMEKLEEIGAAYCAKVDAFDPLEIALWDNAFHAYIVSISKNKKLQKYIKDLLDFFTYAKVQNIKNMKPDGATRSKAEHREILDVIRNRDAVKAKELLALHLQKLKYLNDEGNA